MKWLRALFKRKPVGVTIMVIPRQATKIRLHEWRADLQLCRNADRILSLPDMQMMMAVLHNEHPAFVVADPGTALQDRAVLQARCEGYTMAIANLEALGQHQKLMVVPEADFAPEEQPTKE